MSVIVDWAEVVNAVSYNVYRSPDGTAGSYALQANVPSNVYNDPTGAETDFYQVISVNIYGDEGASSKANHLYTPETVVGSVAVCKVFGNILDIHGHPDPDIEVRFELDCATVPQTVQNAGMTTDVISVSTNRDGYFEINLVQGALVTIFIPDMKHRVQFAVPASSSINFKDIVGVAKKIVNPF